MAIGFASATMRPPMPWLAVAAIACLAVILTGLCAPRARGRAAIVLAAACSACFGYGLAARHGSCTLRVENSFPAFMENVISDKAFFIESVTAPCWQWPALLGGLFALWTVWLVVSFGRGKPPAVVTAAAFVWLGVATILSLEKAAAPAELVGWIAVEVVCLFGTLCCAFLMARIGVRVRVFFAVLILFTTLVRVPIALFSAWATQHRLGTHLDVHPIRFFANWFTQESVDVAAGSSEQLLHLVWLPLLLVFPMITFLIAGGIGFAVLMFVQHPPPAAQPRGSPAPRLPRE